MPPRRFTVSLDENLCQRMDTALKPSGQSRSEYVAGLIRADLGEKLLGSAKKDRGREVVKRDETQQALDKLLDQALLNKLQDDPDSFLDGLDDKTFATLVAARAPKPKGGDEALEESYLSLSRALDKLPDAADLGRELGRAKNRLKKLEVELELQSGMHKSLRGWLKKKCGDEVWQEVYEQVHALEEAIDDYVRDCAGRGLTPERLKVMCLYHRKGAGAADG